MSQNHSKLIFVLWRLTLIEPCTNQNKTAIYMKIESSPGSWSNFMVHPQASGPQQGAWHTKPSQSVHLWWTPDWQSSLWFPVWCDTVAVTVSDPSLLTIKERLGFMCWDNHGSASQRVHLSKHVNSHKSFFRLSCVFHTCIHEVILKRFFPHRAEREVEGEERAVARVSLRRPLSSLPLVPLSARWWVQR